VSNNPIGYTDSTGHYIDQGCGTPGGGCDIQLPPPPTYCDTHPDECDDDDEKKDDGELPNTNQDNPPKQDNAPTAVYDFTTGDCYHKVEGFGSHGIYVPCRDNLTYGIGSDPIDQSQYLMLDHVSLTTQLLNQLAGLSTGEVEGVIGQFLEFMLGVNLSSPSSVQEIGRAINSQSAYNSNASVIVSLNPIYYRAHQYGVLERRNHPEAYNYYRTGDFLVTVQATNSNQVQPIWVSGIYYGDVKSALDAITIYNYDD
jgi:hypothetical protein